MPFYGVMVDLFVFIIFFLLIILPLFLNGKLNLPRERTQICILLVLAAVLVLVQLFITYRVNVSTTLVLAVLAVLLFPREILETKFVSHVLSVLFVMGIAIAFSVVFAYSLPTAAQSTYGFIKFNTPQESNILADPALGHSLIYFAERKTLSDLAVEYAYEGMIDDSYKFLETRDISILGKYGINYVVNRSNYIEEQPVGSPYHDEKIEFEKLDKIYSNGTFYVHAYGR
jgi:4-amino-4-deoxy-L-arabinose transferase-like glycosyltransferase